MWVVPSLGEWINSTAKTQRWLVEGLVPVEALILVSGQKKRAHKTWLAFLLAICIAANRPAGPWKVVTPGRVFVIEQEGPREGTKQRWLGLLRTLGVDPSTVGIDFSFHDGVKLDSKEWQKAIIEQITTTKPVLVILDAIVYMHRGDENKVVDMAPVIETLHAMRKCGCSVMFLAHTATAKGMDRGMDIDDQVRGTGLLTDAYDTHLALRRVSMKDHFISLTVRDRDREQTEYNLHWTFTSTPDGEVAGAALSVEGTNVTPPTAVLGDAGQALIALKRYTRKSLADTLGVPASEAQAVVDSLLASGTIVGDRSGYYLSVNNNNNNGAGHEES